MDEIIKKLIDSWTAYRQMNRSTNEPTHEYRIKQLDRQTDGLRDRKTDLNAGVQPYRQANGIIDK